jgi:hypothetical protein
MRHLAGSFCSLGLGLSALCHAVMADSQPQNAGRDAFVFRNVQQADDHFAVALRSQQQGMTIERHLVLIDTSASQTGKFRSDSLELLKSLGSTLPQNHLVQVVAVDSTFAPLSEGFVNRDLRNLRLPSGNYQNVHRWGQQISSQVSRRLSRWTTATLRRLCCT